jgi:hypothetical protein
MMRASWGDQAYWDKWRKFCEKVIREKLESLRNPAVNRNYESQYVWNLCKEYLRFSLTSYSSGDPIQELSQYFPGLLDAWELSNKLAAELNTQLKPGEGWDHRHITPRLSDDPRAHTDPRAWIFKWSNLNHYNWCFWLLGLALALEIPDDQWQRLVTLIDNEGEDALLDRLIASRQPGRTIGATLLHPKPYARLLNAIEAPKDKQATLLRDFVAHWYAELERKGNNELWWYIYGDPVKNPLEKGSYFGRWCIEAVAAVKAFGLDDSLCLGHEHYPGDLLRPDGPTTHPVRHEATAKGWLARWWNGKKSNT